MIKLCVKCALPLTHFRFKHIQTMFPCHLVVNQSDPVENNLFEFEPIESLHQHTEVLVRGHVIISEQPRVIIAKTHSQSVPDHHFQWMVGYVLLLG